jgi:hypothetical protein
MTKKTKAASSGAALDSKQLRAAGGGFGAAHTSDGAKDAGQNGPDPSGGN